MIRLVASALVGAFWWLIGTIALGFLDPRLPEEWEWVIPAAPIALGAIFFLLSYHDDQGRELRRRTRAAEDGPDDLETFHQEGMQDPEYRARYEEIQRNLEHREQG